ncbi:lytic murein transglycosylase [Methylocystis bryophila]|uniref:Murein transglycosylase n=1 Tax=Methylocystis bryophila TaxID=655015 RepID=A0A1W6MV27_9HYPH|nr:lytic transglycosylase domain-containing protein [Methylocystis bryophila]ARN81339.1 murein transglycosylase [Methylocystis bryophila]BDV37322.1 murein transglycosylase [Methylocystis bryophila]
MKRPSRLASVLAATLLAGLVLAPAAKAARCGNGAAGFDSWKEAYAQEARAAGHSQQAVDALLDTHYNHPTIGADRGQHSFHLSLDDFLAKRGGPVIASRGRSYKQRLAPLFDNIEARYGVPPGPLLAIWGMETGFGSVHGNQHALSAIATLAYDCRRSEYFTDQLNAFLTLIDRGRVDPGARGSMHGEIGQTQFLPKNILEYGVGGSLEASSAALMSTANFLHAHGWRAGAGYQPGEPNFAAIQAWNAAPVYEKAIALIGNKIDRTE